MFLESSGVLERLENGQPTKVLEIGFGLGLNFLITADKASSMSTRLDYHAYEHDLVDCQTLGSMGYEQFLTNPGLLETLTRELYRNSSISRHMKFSPTLNCSVELQDASVASIPCACYHAIYLDAFSPDNNSECWTPEFMSALAQALTADGRLVTYSAKGSVRRAMLTAGLDVQKLPGPPGKREFLLARGRTTKVSRA